MEDVLKKNLRKSGLFMLIAAISGLLMIPAVKITGYLPKAPAVLIVIYTLWNIFTFVWSSFLIIPKLPTKESWKTILFFLWLVFYPVLCVLYIAICCFLAIYVFNIH